MGLESTATVTRVNGSPLRVLLVTNMFPSARHPSYGIFVAEQVRSLREAGLDVEVFFFSPRETRLNYGLVLPRLVRTLRSKRYDLLHTHHTYSLLLVELARRLARTPIPVVVTNHEGEALDAVKETRTWHPTSKLRHSLAIKRFAAQRADFTIFVSRQLSAAISQSIPHDVIPCGVDLGLFRPLDRQACRERLGLPRDAVVIFFPNNPRGRGKKFTLVEDTFNIVHARVPGSILVSAGGIPYDVMPIYYNAADVVLQASYYEASPTVVKETLACEVPLVSTDSGDTREIVEGVPYCFVCRDDPRDMADRTLMCLNRRATGGRERLVQRELGLSQVARRVIRVYQQVAAGTEPAHSHPGLNSEIGQSAS